MSNPILLLFSGIALHFCITVNSAFAVTKDVVNGNFRYSYVENDPLKARIYTLKNGLKVYLTVNKDEPRVQTFIAVRAGSKHDPADATGLAHYLEHMVFKGTDKISTYDWEKEKVLLDQISDLYEDHRNTDDMAQRKVIYGKIDSISGLAAKYAIANEYDKMISSIGAKGTNAYTWVEQTVYMNEVPSNELERWMMIESARFKKLVLRLFHTELEAVYEEFNRGQDSDFRKLWREMNSGLFQKHPYGTQTTIGKGEHLKNPSMKKIHAYFDTYYVPNNIAICLSGDMDPDETIAMIDRYFGSWPSKPVPEFKFEKEAPITSPIVKEVLGSQEEMLGLGFRFDGGAGTREAMMMELVDMILLNGQAGLIDLNLLQQQKVLEVNTSPMTMEDYSMFVINANPREGQSLEEVKDLLLEEIEKVKSGNFEEWLIKACVNQLRLRRIKEYETNGSRAHAFVHAFVTNQKWDNVVNHFDHMDKVTKAEIVEFAKTRFKDNYVVVYKRTGVDKGLFKVEKPEITPVEVNRDKQSEFLKSFSKMPSQPLKPVFLDYKKDIQAYALKSGLSLQYVRNEINETFELNIILDMGADHDREFALAMKYLPYLGTDKYTAEQLQQEFFKLGVSMDATATRDRIYVTLSGLEESMQAGAELLLHILGNVKANGEAYQKMVEGIIKEREDNKLSKYVILNRALVNYAKYGKNSAFTNILSAEELNRIKPEQLIDKIKSLTSYRYRIFYYGNNDPAGVQAMIDSGFPVPDKFLESPDPKKFPELTFNENKVYFIDYDMVQAEMIMLAKSIPYDHSLEPTIRLYNQYFGSGLSSIVFQEIREAKALAYAAYANYQNPRRSHESNYIMAYVGTQADKLGEAVSSMSEIVENMPEAEEQFNAAKEAIIKKIESERITKTNIFWSYERAKRKSLDFDIRSSIYRDVPNLTLDHVSAFAGKYVKNNKYIYLVLGSKDKIDMEVLQKLGTVQTLTLEEVFNY